MIFTDIFVTILLLRTNNTDKTVEDKRRFLGVTIDIQINSTPYRINLNKNSKALEITSGSYMIKSCLANRSTRIACTAQKKYSLSHLLTMVYF